MSVRQNKERIIVAKITAHFLATWNKTESYRDWAFFRRTERNNEHFSKLIFSTIIDILEGESRGASGQSKWLFV